MGREIKSDELLVVPFQGNFFDALNNSSIHQNWRLTLGNGDLATWTEDGAKLSCTYPSGTATEWYGGTYNAPRAYIPIVQDDDWDAIAFVSNINVASNYVSCGLLFWDDTNNANFHRFDIGYSGGYQIRAIYGPSTIAAQPAYALSYGWMRFAKRGNTLMYLYSTNALNNPPKYDKDWTLLYSMTSLVPLGRGNVGFFGTSVSAVAGFTWYYNDFTFRYRPSVALIAGANTNDQKDAFNNSSIDPIWTQDTGLSSAGTFAEDGTKLTIGYPAGAAIDWWNGTYTSPRLYQTIDMARDFDVSVFVSNVPAVNASGGGFLLHENGSNGVGQRLVLAYTGSNNFYTGVLPNSYINAISATNNYGWIRLLKQGSKLLYFYKNADLANRPKKTSDWDYYGSTDLSGNPNKLNLCLYVFTTTTSGVSVQFQDLRLEYLANSYTVIAPEAYADPADIPPMVANAKDDEFNGSTLDAKWTWVRAGAPSGAGEGYSLARSGLIVKCGTDSASPSNFATEDHSLLQSVPSGEWTIKAKIRSILRVVYHSVGLICDDGGNTNASLWQITAFSSNGVNIKNNQLNGGSWTFDQFAGMQHNMPAYIGMSRNSSNLLTMLVSADGIEWGDVGSWTPGWTPTRFGLTFWTANATYKMVPIIVDWFRVSQP